MAFRQYFIFVAMLAFLVLTAFVRSDPVFYDNLFSVPSKNPEKTREAIEEHIESIKDSSLEVIGHDGKFVYILNSRPISSTGDADADTLAYNVHDESLAHFGRVMSDADIDEWKLVGQPGRIHRALLPPHFLESFNRRVPEGYTPPKELRESFENYAENYDFVQWIDFAKEYANVTSIEGRPIHALRINYKPKETRPSILIVSAHHSRELITPEIALNLADMLLEGYEADDEQVMEWLNNYDIWIVPVLNVDGHEHVWEKDNMWRKNRRQHKDGSYGVDLNRNYDLGWETQGGSALRSSETFRGESPFSEPETFALKKLSEKLRFAKVMDFHSSGREVLLHYSRLPMPDIMKNFIASEGAKLAKAANYGTRVPSDDGEHHEWQIKKNTAYAFLVETGTSFQPAFEFAESEVQRVLPLIREFFNRPISVEGRVVDAEGNPIHANIEVEEVKWQLGETRETHPESGAYYLFLPAGEYTIKFSANGVEKSAPVTVSDDSTVSLNIQL